MIIDESALEKNNRNYLPSNQPQGEKKLLPLSLALHCNKVKWRSNIENQLHVLHKSKTQMQTVKSHTLYKSKSISVKWKHKIHTPTGTASNVDKYLALVLWTGEVVGGFEFKACYSDYLIFSFFFIVMELLR